MLAATGVYAQDSSEKLEQVVVTGTHITNTSTFTTPTPVTVIDANTIQSLGLTSVNAAWRTWRVGVRLRM